ncbi:unnamed protein product [Mytilus edulis]|uniref:Uncharacterized protein n=1 Tax=Mytilus edulis TaxID=6550 RepID=A0A8S3T0X4_MYTED|nr:unnamed protein product [Mytilus edulis]
MVGTMHQPSNGSSTQENTAGNNAPTIKWVFNTVENTAGTMHQIHSNESSNKVKNTAGLQCINHQMASTHREYAGNNASTIKMSLQHRKNTEEYSREQCEQTIKWVFNTGEYGEYSLIQGEYSRNNASTIKWVINSGEYSRTMNQMSLNIGRIQGTMHQPSNGSSTQENTAGNNASTIKWVFNRRIQQGTMHQPSNESSTQENTGGNNASTIK